MITAEQMTKALFILESYGLMAARQGQAMVWLDLVNESASQCSGEDLQAAVRKLGASRTTDGKGGAWITVGDLIAQMRSSRRANLETQERERRQIESGGASVASIDVARLMADARSGMTPEEIGRRAKERALSQNEEQA